ncbi:hypothetical protein H2248_007479 [Termitomyces sp. 'cryptogamus']|nr:hypothetical protein H2248_007479 [Termitomyces sp. 'cryptogamus']
MNKVGEVGGIVGAAVSGSFLFIVGLANTIILWRILKQRRRETLRNKRIARGEILPDLEYKPHHNHMLMMRILGPLMTFVNRPWKMYPVGLLFGFGFDTASSIALLAISAVAKRGSDGRVIPSSNIIILPLLFTAGMTLVDSADSILMLYSYIGFPKRGWVFIEKKSTIQEDEDISPKIQDKAADSEALAEVPRIHSAKVEETEVPMSMTSIAPVCTYSVPRSGDGKISRDREVKMNVMSGLSIILTIMSILVAFRCVYLHLHSVLQRDRGMNIHWQHFINHYHGPHWRTMQQVQSCCGGRGWRWIGRELVESVGKGER